MPRANRRRRDDDDDSLYSLERLRAGLRRTETRRGVEWTVQPISPSRAVKEYTCPGCGRPVGVGVEHVVVWRSGGVLGDAADLAARRHWHTHCWRIS